MSHFVDRLTFFRAKQEKYSQGHGIVTNESRAWEDAYRKRWSADKIVRSTHGVNCTGSCSWKIYVKGGIVTWETQQTDYPRTRPDLPNHEPRGCPRGASYSWYLYSGTRVKYPLVRARLIRHWREARKTLAPVAAWASIAQDADKRQDWVSKRGRGGFIRVSWDEINELIAAANAHTIREYGPDRVAGFSPIPAMSMISYASGSRYLSMLGGTILSFYDWYCDLPPSSPQTWGEQTDVPESADWYNAGFLLVWGSNVPMTRAPDAHFYSEVRYRGAKSAVISPDYNEAAKFSDIWMHPKQGTDAALALAFGHVVLREFHLDRKSEYFTDYTRRYSDFPLLVTLTEKEDGTLVPDRMLRAADLPDGMGESNNPDWKAVGIDETSGDLVAPQGSVGHRWGEAGRWNLEQKDGKGREISLRMTLAEHNDGIEPVAFPYFGGSAAHDWKATAHDRVLMRNIPVKQVTNAAGETVRVATVFDLYCANYGLDRGFGGENVASDYDADVPFTPAWAEAVTGVKRDAIIQVAREFAETAEMTEGRSMVILGAGLNHWYHMDMSYRGIIQLLVMCGCIGKSGGGWAHYVGQEKLRPQTGWLPLAFALDWTRPPRQMNGTSFFYAHSGQWRYESMQMSELLSPTAPEGDWSGSMIDYNVRAERMGWLPSAPQLHQNPLELGAEIARDGGDAGKIVAERLKSGKLQFANADPDDPKNWPRNMFFWRSNVLGASGKGHEYFLKHFVGSMHGVIGSDDAEGLVRPDEVAWHDEAPVGKLDLMVNIDFRMSTTSLYSDIVLPTATWYEKHDLNTTDMHPFIHPLTAAVDPAWEARSDWAIFRGLAEAFSRVAPEVLGVEQDVVLTPIQHDSPGEIAQPYAPKDWGRGECDPVPGVTMPSVALVERNYPDVFARYTSLGPALEKLGNGSKGMNWDTAHEVELLGELNGVHLDGPAKGRPKIDADIDACETILMLAPETNGEVAVKAWEALSKATGRSHKHLAEGKEEEKIRFRDVAAQPRKIISSPTWSGIESETVCYNAGYTNVHELIPWRTLTGRQQTYQDHHWMRAFGEAFVTWKPPIDTRSVAAALGKLPNGNTEIQLNFLTPHQKWGIHSTYTENLIMLSLNRGGPAVWISEDDAKAAGIVDNDWIEAFNVNGALTARAIVSQRIMPGSCIMYHAQEKLVNTVGSEMTGQRGGIHNSVTRINMKPTHMIGGYAQLAYGFNYYGTVGANRDEIVILRKMSEVNWFDKAAEDAEPAEPAGQNDAKEAAE